MNYKEFVDKIGKVSTPNSENDRLFHGNDSAHFIIVIGTILGTSYKMMPVEKNHRLFLEYITTLRERGAVRDQDYCIASWSNGSIIFLGLNFIKNQFLSEEDYPKDIPVFRSTEDGI